MTDPDQAAQTPSSSHTLTWAGVTHVGRFRSNNEDAFLMLRFNGQDMLHLGKTGSASLDGADFIFAVSDGMGGARSGEFASRIAADRIIGLFHQTFRMSAVRLDQSYERILNDLFTTIHRNLLHIGQSYEECSGMGATLSLCWFSHRRMYFGHIGDSRIYRMPKGGKMEQLTHDHTHPGWLRRQGKLNEREARTHPLRSSLHQVLGAGHQMIEPQLGAVDYNEGDRFLICSDGLVDGIWDHHLEDFLREGVMHGPDLSLAQRMVNEAVEASGRDNATAVLVETPSPAGEEAGFFP